MEDLIKIVEKEFSAESELPKFSAGDTVTVSYKIKEGNKERIQNFRGVVIQIRGREATKTFTVRKMSGNIGVERIFPIFSPAIDRIEITKKARARRSKLYYIRTKAVKDVRKKMRAITMQDENKEDEVEAEAEVAVESADNNETEALKTE